MGQVGARRGGVAVGKTDSIGRGEAAHARESVSSASAAAGAGPTKATTTASSGIEISIISSKRSSSSPLQPFMNTARTKKIQGDDPSLRPRKFRGFELRFHPAEKVFPQVLDCANPFQDACKLPEIPIYVSECAPMSYQGVEYTAMTYTFYYKENPSPAMGGLFPRKVGYHEGDVERLSILYSKDPYREWEPCHVYFFAHGKGQGLWLPWGECQHTDDNYLIVYVAKNSHASYYMPGTYVRLFGVANDHCSERGKHLRVTTYLRAFNHKVAKGIELSEAACIPPLRSVKPWERFAWPIVANKVKRDCAKPLSHGADLAAAAAATAMGISGTDRDHPRMGSSSCEPPAGIFCGCASLPTPGRQRSKKTQALQVQFSLAYPDQARPKPRPAGVVNRLPVIVYDEERPVVGERTQPMQVPGPTFQDHQDAIPVDAPASSATRPRTSVRSQAAERVRSQSHLSHSFSQGAKAADASGLQEEDKHEVRGPESKPLSHSASSSVSEAAERPIPPSDHHHHHHHGVSAESMDNRHPTERTPVTKIILSKSRLVNPPPSSSSAGASTAGIKSLTTTSNHRSGSSGDPDSTWEQLPKSYAAGTDSGAGTGDGASSDAAQIQAQGSNNSTQPSDRSRHGIASDRAQVPSSTKDPDGPISDLAGSTLSSSAIKRAATAAAVHVSSTSVPPRTITTPVTRTKRSAVVGPAAARS